MKILKNVTIREVNIYKFKSDCDFLDWVTKQAIFERMFKDQESWTGREEIRGKGKKERPISKILYI